MAPPCTSTTTTRHAPDGPEPIDEIIRRELLKALNDHPRDKDRILHTPLLDIYLNPTLRFDSYLPFLARSTSWNSPVSSIGGIQAGGVLGFQLPGMAIEIEAAGGFDLLSDFVFTARSAVGIHMVRGAGLALYVEGQVRPMRIDETLSNYAVGVGIQLTLAGGNKTEKRSAFSFGGLASVGEQSPTASALQLSYRLEL